MIIEIQIRTKLVEQELLTIPEHSSSFPIFCGFLSLDLVSLDL